MSVDKGGENSNVASLVGILESTINAVHKKLSFFNWVLTKKNVYALDRIKCYTESKKPNKKTVTEIEESCASIYSYLATWIELYLLCFPDVSGIPTYQNMQNFSEIILNFIDNEEEELVRLVWIYKLGLMDEFPPLTIPEIAKMLDVKETLIIQIVGETTQDMVVECRNSLYLMPDYINNKKGSTRFGNINNFKEL